MPRVYDCFLFMDEFDLLELRLNELDPVVDFFVLAEATVFFRGTPKPLYFGQNRERFRRFADKIIHVVVEDMPGGGETERERWVRERFQRGALLRGLENANSEDFVIISDVDEIPRASAVKFVAQQRNVVPTRYTFEMQMYFYFLNLKHPESHMRTSMGRRARVRNPEIFRMWGLPWTTPTNALKRWRKTLKHFRSPLRLVTVPDAGWHFTCMNGIEVVRQKLVNYSHVRPDHALTEAAISSRIEDALASARRPFDGTNFRLCEIDGTYPQYLLNNIDKYKHMILPSVRRD